MSVNPVPASLMPLTKGFTEEELGLAPPSVESAHDAFVQNLTQLANRLRMCEDIKKSESKRVAVRGVLLGTDLHIPGLKFSVEFREKAVYRIRVQTLNEDVDRAAVSADVGGEGLMEAAGGSGAESTPAPARKRARKEVAAREESLVEVLQRAMDIAFMSGNADLVAKLEPLLKSC